MKSVSDAIDISQFNSTSGTLVTAIRYRQVVVIKFSNTVISGYCFVKIGVQPKIDCKVDALSFSRFTSGRSRIAD